MYNKDFNKRLIFILIVVLAVSLTTLGIKFPSSTGISSSGKPKPRPRAIIKNQIKTCKQIIKKIPPAAAVVESRQINYCPLTALPSQSSHFCRRPLAVAAQTLSRAPPQLS